MSKKTKITILVSASIFLLIALLAFYFFFLKNLSVEPGTPGTFPPPEGNISPGTEQPTVLPDEHAGAKNPLQHLTTVPIAGAVAGGKGGEVRVRYVDRALGNVFEIPAGGGETTRLTNKTIPKVYEALWNKAGTGVILRYLKDDNETIQTFSAHIKAGIGGTPGELQGSFLPANILSIALSPSTDELLYIREEQGDGVATRASFDGTGKVELWRSPLREWLPLWSNSSTILLQSKPSVLSEGALLSLDRATGESATFLAGISGLTALPNSDLSTVMYSESTNSNFSSHTFNKTKNERKSLLLTTLPEKCVWAKDDVTLYCGVPTSVSGGSYPDIWYQGVVSFTDELWSIHFPEQTTTLVSLLKPGLNDPIDLVQPSLSPDESYLIFTNRNDGTLWSYRLRD